MDNPPQITPHEALELLKEGNRRFLSDADSSRWRSLVALIDHELVAPACQAAALAAARAAFALFEAAARAQAGVRVLEH